MNATAIQSQPIASVSIEIQPDFTVVVTSEEHTPFAQHICDEMEASAKARGTGIAKRSPEYVAMKMTEGKAFIAFDTAGNWAGFCYIENWGTASTWQTLA